ncbi:MAG TPA: STAS domain-containing protein [Candidatus Baltobacteraceae bacterium]
MTGVIPIQKIGQTLIASIQSDLSDDSTVALHSALSSKIVETGARGVIIDISALEIVDSFIGRMLATIAATSRLLDADTVVVGMRPAVAITLTELGLSLGSVRTALNAEKAFALLAQSGVGATAESDGSPSELSDDDSTTLDS